VEIPRRPRHDLIPFCTIPFDPCSSIRGQLLFQSLHEGKLMLHWRGEGIVLSLVVGLSLALGVLPGSSARGDDDKGKETKVEGDLKKIQGEWVSKDEQGAESTWMFKDDHLTIKAPGRGYEITITLNSKAEPEKHMDFTVLDNSPNAKGTKAPGIYKLTADGKLLVCFGSPGGDSRPKEYKTDFTSSFSFELKKK
jgi:uncharacterized protein (TIGR03067 family)